MSSIGPVADDELILRHIPGGVAWQAPPDGRIASTNFRLRNSESGISVTRLSLTTAEQLMARVGNAANGSRVAVACVKYLRAKGFDVVAVPLVNDPGHAEICSNVADLRAKSCQRELAQLFRYYS